MAKKQQQKRKASSLPKVVSKPVATSSEEDSDVEEVSCRHKLRLDVVFKIFLIFQQENILNEVHDNENDSSDSEGALYSSDEDAELSFESDDEGNFQQNPLKATRNGHNSDEEEVDDDEEVTGDENEEDESDSEDGDVEDEGEEVEDENSEFEEHTPASVIPEVTTPLKVSKPKFNMKSKKPNAAQALSAELKADAPAKKIGEDESNDEYNEDTSDEEDIRNTVGNIPMHWYDEYKHIGYDWDAKKIIKAPRRDQLDDFLKRMEDPNFWRTVKDAQTGQDIVISEADIELIKRINSQKIPDASYDDYAVSWTWKALRISSFIFFFCFVFYSLGSNGLHLKSNKCQ